MEDQRKSEMDPDRWEKIEALYNSVLPLTPLDRASRVEQLCAGDEGLRRDLLSLLESADTSDSFLEAPALSFGFTVLGLENETPLGENLGRYKVLKSLGHGGMGEVYLAQDPRLNRYVALKLLPGIIADDRERVRRFEQEARAASAISHPNVAHIYEIGEVDGRHYITMEYIKGPTLRQMLRQRALEPNKALEIAIQVATALSAAHRAGVIHRDIKPENILMAEDGYVKVLDFGLAKLIADRGSDAQLDSLYISSIHTEPELFMGTSHYMSPEQIRRQKVDKRTDLWSLGVVIYEMLTFRRPFKGQVSEVIVEIIEQEPELASRDHYSFPAPVQAFLSKALSKRPDDRYQTAEEMLSDLRALRFDEALGLGKAPTFNSHSAESAPVPEPVSTIRKDRYKPRPASTRTVAEPLRSQTLPQRYNTVVEEGVVDPAKFSLTSRHLLMVLPALLVIAAAAYFGIVSQRPTTLASSAINLRFERLNLSGKISDIALSPDGKYVASVTGDGGKNAIHITELSTASDLQIAPPSDSSYGGLTFSPDGTYVYYLENQAYTGALFRVSKLGGGQRKILSNVNTPVSFSPDGSKIAFTRVNKMTEPADLVVAQADGTSERILARRNPTDIAFFLSDMNRAGPAWSPDGKMVACATRTTTNGQVEINIEVLDAKTGIGRRVNTKGWNSISGLNWLADGSGLIVAAMETAKSRWQLWLVSYPGGEVRQATNDPNNYTRISGNSTSESFLTLNVEEDSNLWTVSVNEGQPFSPRTFGQKRGITEVVQKPDGNLIYVVYDGVNSNLWADDANAQSARQLTFEAKISRRPVVTPDGRRVVFVSNRSGTQAIWRMDIDGTNLQQLTNGPHDDMPSVTADGQWVIYRTTRTISRVSVDGGKVNTLLETQALNPVVSPDGRLLALFNVDGLESEEWHLSIFDFATLKLIKGFNLPEATDPFSSLRWTPTSDGLTFISNADSTSNLWLQPLSNDSPRKLTDFRDAEIQSFSWAPDGREVICVRRAKTYVPLLLKLF